jgi:hypothetical protein
MFVNESGRIFIEGLPRMLPTKFQFIWPSDFRGDFWEINQSETKWPVVAMYGNGSGRNEQTL